MNSIERVREYAFLEQEPPEIIPGHRPSESWPYEGKVEFVDFCLRYRSVNDLALKNVSFSVKSHERVGIVGRSGAGKSRYLDS
jgi:ABC-type multidrug transport system fused ATPase/permease subunit